MVRQRFAKNTLVGVSRSRGQIDKILRDWGATAIQWTDEYQRDRVTLRFSWEYKGVTYMARFVVHICPITDMDILDGRSGQVSENKKRKAESLRGMQEHRVLLLWIKAALNAIDAGIVDAAAIFLPFLEDSTGVTVAEIAIPKLASLPTGKVAGLLPSAN